MLESSRKFQFSEFIFLTGNTTRRLSPKTEDKGPLDKTQV
jgi:hypothetical protein